MGTHSLIHKGYYKNKYLLLYNDKLQYQKQLLEIEPFCLCKFCDLFQIAAEQQSSKMVADRKVHTKWRCH